MNIKIVSGGRAPARWLAEKPLGAIPEAYRAAMREYPDQGSNAQNYRARTKANVRDGHASSSRAEARFLVK